jgi:hypothetical protein
MQEAGSRIQDTGNRMQYRRIEGSRNLTESEDSVRV